MIPWIELDTASMPGGGELRLKQRGSEFSIMLGPIELMNSRLSGSERALATLSCERIADRPKPNILIGGLGMGFTLRAALEVLGPEARVDVAELVPAVVAWARGPMADVYGGSLADPRVHIREGDVGRLIKQSRETYDVIMLDVDNGPEGLSRKANDALYDRAGIGAARAALRPGGVLSVWSSSPNRAFSRRLREMGFRGDEVSVRANRSGRGAKHTIWVATHSDRPVQPKPRRESVAPPAVATGRPRPARKPELAGGEGTDAAPRKERRRLLGKRLSKPVNREPAKKPPGSGPRGVE